MKEGIALPRSLKENVGPFVSILLLCLAPHGVASDITYHYEGAITSVQNLGGPPPSFLFTSLFAPGRSWTLDFTCNAQAPDLNPSSPNIGFFPGAGRSLTFNCGNGLYTGSLSGAQLDVYVDNYASGSGSADDITMQGSTRGAPPSSQQVQFASVGGQELLAIAVELRDDTGAALSTDALPVSLSTMPNGTFFMDWGPSDGTYFYRVYGAIGSQSVVPEPSVSVIFLLGGCAASLRWGHLVQKNPRPDQRG